MVEAGVAFVVLGAALLVAEAHVPSGLLGAAGSLTLAGGAALALAGLGGGTVVVLAAVLGTAVVSGLWVGLPSWPDEPQLATGDPVVVERVSGLTLAVRRAEEWEEF